MTCRCLVETDLDHFWRLWEVVMPDGERRPSYPLHLEPDGFVSWHWWSEG